MDKQSLCRGPCPSIGIHMAVSTTGPGKGGGVLERPAIGKTPARESEFDVRYRFQNFQGYLLFLSFQFPD